jgi:TonB-dependent Receptor Plug Domain.
MQRFLSTLSLVLLASCSATLGLAQTATGSLQGEITDPNGAAVPGVRVTALHEPTGQQLQTITTDAGIFIFPSLPTGPYSVSAEKEGFKKASRSNVEIRVAQRQLLDIRLEVGDVQQVVEVVGEVPLLETQTAERGQNFSTKFMNTLPLFTGGIRNPENFVSYMPGVNSGSNETSITGSGGRAKEVLLDGASQTIPESGGVVFNFPASEQFGEFKLITSNYSAEYGRFGGGVEVFITKSGTNDLHGGAFLNLRRDIWNAAGWNVNRVVGRTPGYRPKERFNEVGGVIGGPVWLPKVYDGRNRTFWFFTIAKDLRPASISQSVSTLPTVLMKQGNFSEIPQAIYDPLTTAGSGASATRQPFANNIIPQSRFSTVSRNLIPLIPLEHQ